ncbi:MAG: hypothetical protein QNJ34_27440 [Xenococcaceae cyanobacterium MO_188.B29]|nr:hypothetical protein [Xenococcaceae cyanobacterium MO_188.B29]
MSKLQEFLVEQSILDCQLQSRRIAQDQRLIDNKSAKIIIRGEKIVRRFQKFFPALSFINWTVTWGSEVVFRANSEKVQKFEIFPIITADLDERLVVSLTVIRFFPFPDDFCISFKFKVGDGARGIHEYLSKKYETLSLLLEGGNKY